MTLFGALKAIVLPPVSLLLLILAGLLLGLRWRRAGWSLSFVAALAMLVLAMPVTGAALMASLSTDLSRTPPPTNLPAAVVILSAEARAVDRSHTRYEPGPLTWERLLAGVQIARTSRLPILVSGGPIRSEGATLAGVMANSMALLFNLPPRWQENRSRDTWENARFSAEILKENGIHSVYLVSHGWHLHRATIAFNHFGITVTAVPVRPDPWPGLSLDEFVPSLSGWTASFYGMHEWIGSLYYTLRG
jgi:uncharacterized SAM-binding protein YcdF (DUF218 family)